MTMLARRGGIRVGVIPGSQSEIRLAARMGQRKKPAESLSGIDTRRALTTGHKPDASVWWPLSDRDGEAAVTTNPTLEP